MSATEIPNLPHGCNSWIVSAPDGRVFELYDRPNVRKAAADSLRGACRVPATCYGRAPRHRRFARTGAQP